MSCAPTPCPPLSDDPESPSVWSVPTPVAPPTWVRPNDFACALGPVYSNTEQSYTDTCSGVSSTPPITAVIAAGTYTSSVSEGAANDLAMAAAQALAENERLLNPCVIADLLTTETGDFLTTESGVLISLT